MAERDGLNWIAEFGTFAFMLGLSVTIGLYYGCVKGTQNTVSEYLLGGKHMSVFPITVSLIASHVSSITLLGVPSEIYVYGTQYLIIGLSNLIVITVVMYVFLPVFYELQLTSVFEYLERRFDPKIRALASLIYTVHLILFIPIVIYIPALAFNQVTGVHVYVVTSIICVICIFYTTIGGLKTVVWTDVIQSFFIVVSLIVMITLGLKEVGGFSNIIKSSQEGNRTELFRMDPNPFLRHSFWTVGIGLTFNWIMYLGVHPGAVQRFVSLPTFNQARKALVYFVLGVTVILLMTGTVGMIIYTKYKDCDPVRAQYIKSDRNLVPYYVMDVIGKFPGFTGLFISGIISAALGTTSAQLNTVAGTIYEDLIVNIFHVHVSQWTASFIMKSTVVIIGFICVALVMFVEKLNGIIQISYSLGGIVSGAILSVFTLGVCFPRANSKGAMWGMLASLGVMTWIVTGAQIAIFNRELMFAEKNTSIVGCPAGISFANQTNYSGLYRMNDDVYVGPNVWKIYTVSYVHYNTIGTIIGIAVGLAISFLFPVDQNIHPKLLTPFIRELMYPNFSSNRAVVEMYIPVSQVTTNL